MVGVSCCRIIPLLGPTCKIAIFHAELKSPSRTECGKRYTLGAGWSHLQNKCYFVAKLANEDLEELKSSWFPCWAEYGNACIYYKHPKKKLHYITQTPSKYNPDTFQTFARNIINIIHDTSRHFLDIFQTTSKHPPNTHNCKGNHQQHFQDLLSRLKYRERYRGFPFINS